MEFKDWFTTDEAAKHLSKVMEEEVSKVNVLRLALAGHLTLSVYFPHGTYAKTGKIHPYFDAKQIVADSDAVEMVTIHRYLLKDKALVLNKDVIRISGLWDFPMIGAERFVIERACLGCSAGPHVPAGLTLEFDAVLVQNEDGKISVIQEQHDGCFKDTSNLPEDSMLVVRTEALREFENKLNKNIAIQILGKEEKENSKDNNSLLKMIITMAKVGYGYDPKDLKSKITSEIVKDAESLGLSIDMGTVRKWLKKGAELLPQNEAD